MIYDIPKGEVKFERTPFYENDKFKIEKIVSNSLVKTNFPKNDINYAYLYLPKSNIIDKPVVLLHGMGKRNFYHLKYFPLKFLEFGIPTLMPILPYHYERKIDGIASENKFLTDDMEDSIQDFRQAIIDIRTNLNFLESIGLGKNGFNLMAFSFGGMIGVILAAVDKRIKNSVLIATGGNYEYVVWKGTLSKFIRKKYTLNPNYETYGCNYEICRSIHANYSQLLEKIHSVHDFERINFEKGCFLFDPLTFAPLLKGKKVLIFRALFDEIFPKESTLQLAKAIGNAKIMTLFSDHYSIIMYRKLIFTKAYNLFVGGDEWKY